MNAVTPILDRKMKAMEDFGKIVAEVIGCTIEQGFRVAHVYIKEKVAKIDTYNGSMSVKHGVFMEKDVLANAHNMAESIFNKAK